MSESCVCMYCQCQSSLDGYQVLSKSLLGCQGVENHPTLPPTIVCYMFANLTYTVIIHPLICHTLADLTYTVIIHPLKCHTLADLTYTVITHPLICHTLADLTYTVITHPLICHTLAELAYIVIKHPYTVVINLTQSKAGGVRHDCATF